MKPKTCRCAGIGLIGLISAMVVMMLLGAGIIMLVTTGVMEEVGGKNRSGAFFAAETGVSRAKYAIFTNASWYANTNAPYMILTGMIGRASFYAVVTTTNSPAPIITSTGTLEEAHWTSIWKRSGTTVAVPSNAMLVYGNATTVGTPIYRIWGGTNWSGPSNALSVGAAAINWVAVKACPKRDEYIMVTQDTNRTVKAQVYTSGTWGNLTAITNVFSITNRGINVAYESLSGDALVVSANATSNFNYYIWNGSTWSAKKTNNFANATRNKNIGWVQLASDPVSDEIILLVHDLATNYTAMVWNGNAWGNTNLLATKSPGVKYEAMAVEYETSGNQALIVSADSIAANFKWNSWNGTIWGTEASVACGDDFFWASLVNDPKSDNLLLTFINNLVDGNRVFWNGAAWGANYALDASIEAITDRCIDGAFQSIAGHTGHAVIGYGNGATATGRHATDPSSITWDAGIVICSDDTATVQIRRTGDGKILALSFNWTDTCYEFAWYGTNWSAITILENEPSVTATPWKEPFMMAPNIYVKP